MADRNAASVLPDPVGATTSVWSPLPIASQAPAWAVVGSANAAVNQSRTSGSNRSSAAAGPGFAVGRFPGAHPDIVRAHPDSGS